MKILSLITSLIGIFILGSLILIMKPIEVENLEDIEVLADNTKVVIEGKISEERTLYEGTKMLKIKDIEAICECNGKYNDKNVRIKGIIDEYDHKKQILVMEIETLN